jgi:CDP-diacylglycerol---serine O-phosphatidyltransferase
MPAKHKALYALPNLVTLTSLGCGFYAIVRGATATQPLDFAMAAAFVFLATLFDGMDGRVARMTRTQSEFGEQLDSLVDVVSSGVAPALILYRWGLEPLGIWGYFGAFAFAACGAMRLARFNVMARQNVPSMKKFFIGLSIPMGAATMMSVVWLHSHLGFETVENPWSVLAVTLCVSFLMVSHVRFYNFKDTSPRGLLLMAMAVSFFGFMALRFSVPAALVAGCGLYLGLGLVGECVVSGRELFLRRSAATNDR